MNCGSRWRIWIIRCRWTRRGGELVGIDCPGRLGGLGGLKGEGGLGGYLGLGK